MRNMADLRAISTAVEAYNIDSGKYPKVSLIRELKRYLQPKYIKGLPITDTWGNDFIYQSNGTNSYTVISLGKDHRPDLKPYVNGPISHFTDDIVFSNGSFVRFPEGT